CLTQALGIGPEHRGADLRGAGPLVLEPSHQPVWSSGPRVGVSRAADRPWRFWATGDETVSAYRRSAHAAR
nr:DNA-3-methyladenine glycosylase [Actinomycetota bacterium]